MGNDVATLVEVGTVPLATHEGEPSVALILARAVEKGVDVATLERLVALKERVDAQEARRAFAASLAAFQAECPPILKTRDNSQFKVTREGTTRLAKYAPLEEIDRVARPVATKHGLLWTWDVRVEAELMHVTCRVSHVMGHSESSTVSMPYASNAGSSPQQKYGSTQTYGMRYSLVAALGITTADEDTDGKSGTETGGALSEFQVRELTELAKGLNVNVPKLLKVLGVGEFGDLHTSSFEIARNLIESKRPVA